MNNKQALARKFGSKTGKLKKKHIARAKIAARGLKSVDENPSSLTNEEITKLLGENNE